MTGETESRKIGALSDDDAYDQFFDYSEVVHGFCTMTGCGWSMQFGWDDFDGPDGTNLVQKKFMEHWAEKHAEAS